MKVNFDFGWLTGRLDGDDDKEERVVDELGFSRITEYYSNRILPNINSRYHSLKYYPIVCIGMKLVNEYLQYQNIVSKDENMQKAEVSGKEFKKMFRRHMDYYEYCIAKLIFDNSTKDISYIGSTKIDKIGGFVSIKGVVSKSPRKYFLTSAQTYAFDRYKTSLEYCNLIRGNALTPEGLEFVDLILKSKGWKSVYNTCRKIFFGKLSNKNKAINCKCDYDLKNKESKAIRQAIKKTLVDLNDKGSAEGKVIREVYKRLKKQINKRKLFENASFLQAVPDKPLRKEMEHFFTLTQPILMVLTGIREARRFDRKATEIKKVFNNKVLRMFKNNNKVKNIKIMNRIDEIDTYNNTASFIRDIYKHSETSGDVLSCIRERIMRVKGYIPFELSKGLVKINENVSISQPKTDIFPNYYRMDIMVKIIRELENRAQ